MPFKFTKLGINDLILIEPVVFEDERGYFMEIYKESDFFVNGITYSFCQDNYSFSKKNVLRGLHYQLNPKAQGKLIRVVNGAIWDVVVDLRRSSESFLKWIAMELTFDNRKMLYIPPGCAHGFIALSKDVHLIYKCTKEYDQSLDAGIIWNDPDIKIQWPVKDPIVSEKDKKLPYFKEAIIFK